MKKLIKILSIQFGLLICLAVPVFAAGIVQNIDGFPLMPNFSEIEGAALSFDKPEGRVLEGLVVGRANFVEVKVFYKESLEQIGWNMAPTQSIDPNILHFIKEGESLTLELSENNDEMNIRIFLIPNGSP